MYGHCTITTLAPATSIRRDGDGMALAKEIVAIPAESVSGQDVSTFVTAVSHSQGSPDGGLG